MEESARACALTIAGTRRANWMSARLATARRNDKHELFPSLFPHLNQRRGNVVSKMPNTQYPLVVPSDLMAEVSAAASDSGLSKEDVMRRSMKLGLPKLREQLGLSAARNLSPRMNPGKPSDRTPSGNGLKA